MKSQLASYHRYRFPPDIISHAVWLYHRFCLSFRDTEDLLAQRGVTITYETIRQWCQRFGPVYARWLRRRRGALLHESSRARTMPTDRILTGRCDMTLVGRGQSSDSGSHSRGRPHSPAQLDSGRAGHRR